MIKSGTRKKSVAISKLRALEVLERAIKGEDSPLTDNELKRKIKMFYPDQSIDTLFPNVASIEVIPDNTTPCISLRFTNKEGLPIHIVDEGTPGSYVVGIKKVNDLAYYNLTFNQLLKNVNLSSAKCSAVIWYLNLKEDVESSRKILLGKTSVFKYSSKAIEKINKLLTEKNIEEIWSEYKVYKNSVIS